MSCELELDFLSSGLGGRENTAEVDWASVFLGTGCDRRAGEMGRVGDVDRVGELLRA